METLDAAGGRNTVTRPTHRWITHGEINDATARIDIERATADQHAANLVPGALHARLHARKRNAGASRCFCLRETTDRRHLECTAIRFVQPADERRKTWRQLGKRSRFMVVIDLLGEILGCGITQPRFPSTMRAKRVCHRRA